ncbi:MAG: 2-dehydropantoate 2-reductase [Vulcanimicrobiaceae bacterium]
MRFAVIGAGAIGAYVGASLARAGADVTLVARGDHLAAMQRDGVTVLSPRGNFRALPRAVGRLADVGAVDVVLLALKAHQIAAVADELRTLLAPATTVVAMQNGLPWWYFFRHGGRYDGMQLESVDPGGRIGAAIDPRTTVGCVIYCSALLEAAGVVRHSEGTRFSLGEPDRSLSDRARAIAAAFAAAGLKAPVEVDIRREIWLKLLGNAALNPISALSRATLAEMCDDPLVEPLIAEMMREALAVAATLGIVLETSIERRIDGARRVGAHKTSMLQDLETRKPLELDALLGAIVELGRITGTPTPASRHVFALGKLLERSALAGR